VLSGSGLAVPGKHDFLCLFMQAPTEEEKHFACKEVGFSKDVFSTYESDKRSRTYSSAPLVFSIIDYYVEGHVVKHCRFLLAVSKKCLLISVPSKSAYYEELFELMKVFLAKSGSSSLEEALYWFLREDVEENYDVVEKMDEKIVEIEQTVLDPDKTTLDKLREISELKHELAKIGRRFWASARTVNLIKQSAYFKDVPHSTLELLDGLHDAYVHQVDLLTTQRELLSDSLALYEASLSNKLAIISNDLNIIMKKLTALTVIIMVPTLIAGVYGMNVLNLPIAQTDYGFPFTVALMLLSGIGSYIYFHKKDYI